MTSGRSLDPPWATRRLRSGMFVGVRDGTAPVILQVPPGELTASLGQTCVPSRPWAAGLASAASVGVLLVATATSAWLLAAHGYPDGAALLAPGQPLALSLVLVIVAAVVGSVLHELAHMVLGRARGQSLPRAKVNGRTAVARTNLTHTWVWPFIPRTAAFGGGLAVDLAVLSGALLAAGGRPGAAWLVASVTLLRIAWQLRPHRRTDGRFLLAHLCDDPAVVTTAMGVLRGRALGRPGIRHLLALAAMGAGLLLEGFITYWWGWRLVAQLLHVAG